MSSARLALGVVGVWCSATRTRTEVAYRELPWHVARHDAENRPQPFKGQMPVPV